MTTVKEFAAERRFLDRVAGDLHNARMVGNKAHIQEAVEDLEIVELHSKIPILRERARRLIATAHDPLPNPFGLRA